MITYYISPLGNDASKGTTLDQPFATLNGAKQAVRQHAGKAPITVCLREGLYAQSQPFTLIEQDSGSASASIIYRPYEMETARITGGKTLKSRADFPAEKADQNLSLCQDHTSAASENAEATADSSLFSLSGVHHVSFHNLTVEDTDGNGILLTGGSDIEFAGCVIRNIGKTGIAVEGGDHHCLQSCTITHTGEAGIRIQGGDRKSLTRSDHLVDNCHIHHISRGPGALEPGIAVSGVGIRISHNHVHDCPATAILLSGNEHLIEYNNIHHIGLKTDEGGAIYMGRDWTERGIQIQYNYFHDIDAYPEGGGAICMDDCASGSTILGNLFVRCNRAVFIGGGRNHRIDNNIFVQCEPAVEIDGRGLEKSPRWHSMVYSTMKPVFEALNPLEPPYKFHYPELREVAMYYQAEDGIPPEGNLVLRNVSYQSTWVHIHWHATAKIVALQNNLVDENPLFINQIRDNYQLRETSPAYEIGIKPIPSDRMGLYEDPFRKATNLRTD
jgi:hypothetical protein